MKLGHYCTLFIIAFMFPQVKGQDSLPVLHTNSIELDFEDGLNYYKKGWAIDSSIKVDVYESEMYSESKKITFYADTNKIEFIVKPNNEYDFLIVLNKKDTAYTRIKTSKILKPIKDNLTRKVSKTLSDTIPFSIGKDNRIHLYGKINGSKEIDMLFDTGASAVVVEDSLVSSGTVKMTINKMANNQGSDGVSKVKVSLKNNIEIGNMIWDDVKILSIDYKKPRFEGVLGWRVFSDKIIEINYSLGKMIVHYGPEADFSNYQKIKMRKIDNLYYIELNLIINKKSVKGWFEFDTGSTWSLALNHDFASNNFLHNKMEKISTQFTSGSAGVKINAQRVMLPQLEIGDYEFYQIPITIVDKVVNGIDHDGILGNLIMKRFDVIIDYKNNFLYLKPNNYLHDYYLKELIEKNN